LCYSAAVKKVDESLPRGGIKVVGPIWKICPSSRWPNSIHCFGRNEIVFASHATKVCRGINETRILICQRIVRAVCEALRFRVQWSEKERRLLMRATVFAADRAGAVQSHPTRNVINQVATPAFFVLNSQDPVKLQNQISERNKPLS
jgi:hypothetical protein